MKFHDGADLDANDVVVSYAVQWDAAASAAQGPHRCLRVLPRPVGRVPQPAAPQPEPIASAIDDAERGRRHRRRPRSTIPSILIERMTSDAVTQFILRRLLVTIPVLFGIVFLVFALARLIPATRAGRSSASGPPTPSATTSSAATASTSRSRSSSCSYLQQLASGDLGNSIKHSRPVTDAARSSACPTTIELTLLAMVFAIVVGVPLGLISAYRRNSPVDVGTMVVRQPRRLDAGLRARPVLAFLFAIVLKDTPFVAAAVGPAELAA